jgi:Ras-related protein Rab-1A
MNENSFSSENTGENRITLKILLIGDSMVGKTCLLLNYVDHVFPDEHIATIGVEYKDKYITRDNYNIRLQLWDTAGQERFNSITKNIYRGANGVLFVYDITNRQSFNSVKKWIKDTESFDEEIKGIILGNKIDLEDDRKVDKDELEEFGKERQMKVMEISAKSNINVNECFDLIVDELLDKKTEDEIMERYSRKKKCDLSISSKQKITKKQGCC